MTILSTMGQFRFLLPELTKEERKALEKSLQEDGCRDPIITWHGTIIDGHNRYEICKKHNIPFKIKEMDQLSDADAVKTWMINNQLSRRNLTDEQRERFLGILLNTSKKGRGGVRNNAGRKSKAQIEPLKNVVSREDEAAADTAEMIAQQHGVSRETVKRAGKFATAIDRIGEVSPIAEAKIMRGEAKSIINKGDIRNLADAPNAEVKKVAKAIEKDEPVKKTEKKTQFEQISKTIDEIENRVDIIYDTVMELSYEDREEIANRIVALGEKIHETWQLTQI